MSGLAATGQAATHSWSGRAFDRTLTWALAAFGFFLLFSTAGTNLALGVLLLLCLLAPQRLWRLAPWREPVVLLGLALLAWIALRAFGEGTAREGFAVLNRYRELLLLPILWGLMRMAPRPQAFVNGLLAGALLYALLHWLAPLRPEIGYFLYSRRISAGLALPVCAFLIFEHARLGRLPRATGYAGAAFLALTVLFAAEGRTGHVLLLGLAACAAFRAAPAGRRLALVAAVLALGLALAASSSAVRGRMGQTLAELGTVTQEAAPRAAPSVRIELARSALRVAQQHWLVGAGWPGYPQALPHAASELGVRHAIGDPADNPHNEYLLQWGTGGLPALALFLTWLAWPVVAALRAPAAQRPWAGAAACVALAFAASALVNSALLDFVEGHFHVALLAWLLARRVRA